MKLYGATLDEMLTGYTAAAAELDDATIIEFLTIPGGGDGIPIGAWLPPEGSAFEAFVADSVHDPYPAWPRTVHRRFVATCVLRDEAVRRGLIFKRWDPWLGWTTHNVFTEVVSPA